MLDSLTKTPAPEALVEPSRCLVGQLPANAHAAGPWPMTLARFLTLVGLLASGVTGLIHQGGGRFPKMCARLTPTRCESVILSPYGSVLGIPLPLIGLAAFAIVLGLLLFPKSRGAVLLIPLVVAVATGGLVLLAIQFWVIGNYCVVCVAADVAAMGVGGLVLLARLPPSRPTSDLSPATRRGWIVAGVIAVLASPTGLAVLGMFSVCD